MCMFCRSLLVLFFLFYLAIVLSVLRFTNSDHPFGIFKLFLPYIRLLKMRGVLDTILCNKVCLNCDRSTSDMTYIILRGLRGRYRLVFGFTTTSANSAYCHKAVNSNHAHCEVYSMQLYVIKFVSDIRQLASFLLVLRFPPLI